MPFTCCLLISDILWPFFGKKPDLENTREKKEEGQQANE